MKTSKYYLFDTNILSELIKKPNGFLAQKIMKLESTSFCTSIIVACELRYGALKKNSKNLINRVELLLSNIIVQPFGDEVDRYYAKLRTSLEKKGQLIGGNDMLIAAHALSLSAIVITGNEREFLRVPGLSVENWLENKD